MMTVLDYAEDMNIDIEEVLKKCKELEIPVTKEDDLLDNEHITMLDNIFSVDDSEELEEELTEIKIEPKTTKKPTKIDSKKKLIKKSKIPQKTKKEIKDERKDSYKNREKLTSNVTKINANTIIYKDNMTVGEFALALNVNSAEIIKKLFLIGIMATINNTMEYDQAELLAIEYEKTLRKEKETNLADFENFVTEDNDKDLVKRAPVVTIMGHVDHGKTTLLDYIRSTNKAEGEAGGITQGISAYQVKHNKEPITFIDTPGHAAFTEMRARGASITDIIIIIVAADDGIKMQTKEVIDHAKEAGVPIIVAINKIDKPNINIEKVMTELAEHGLMSDEWGGDTLYNNISALTGEGVNELLDNILLISELNNYQANPNRYASGTVIEAELDKLVGNKAMILVQNGTLRVGDPVVIGTELGRIRTMKIDNGTEVVEATPSMPVEITGISETPLAGDRFMAFETEKEAKKISDERKRSEKSVNRKSTAITLDELFAKIQDGFKELKIILKADLKGSAEAVKNSLEKIIVEGVKINVIRSDVGAITDSDISLASASNAIIIGFNVRPDNVMRRNAELNDVEMRLYNVIYKVLEEVESAMKGMLDPKFEEKIIGTAEVRRIFTFSKIGVIAGSYVTDGIIKANAKARIIREGVVIYDGDIGSIQREKDSVRDVKKGLECGITIEKYNNIEEGDIIEAYEMVEVKII